MSLKRVDGQKSAQACSTYVLLEPEETFERRKQQAIETAECEGYRLSRWEYASESKDGIFEHDTVPGMGEFPATHLHLRFHRDAPD